MERDHRSIAKFENENDPVFQQLVGAVSGFLKQSSVSSSARVFLPWDSSSHFKGIRDTLQELHEVFFPAPDNRPIIEADRHRQIVMIYGDGGLGKTEVALKFARENEYRYNYILFAETTSAQTLRADIISVHESLSLPKNTGGELHDVREFLRQQKQWLFILDNDNNFISLDHFEFPDLDHGHILITCRSRDYGTDPRITKVIEMLPLDVTDAVDLVFSRAEIPIERRAELGAKVKSLVITLGCVPAMVENTAAYMLSFHAGIEDCLRLMGHPQRRGSILRPHTNSALHQLSTEDLFQIHLDTLLHRMPNSYNLLIVLVWLDRTKTTCDFFQRATTERIRWGANGEPEQWKPEWGFVPKNFINLCNSPEFDTAMNNLKSLSLIARDEVFEKATSNAFVMQPYLCEFLRDTTSRRDIVKSILPALSMIAHAYPIREAGLENSYVLRPQVGYMSRLIYEMTY